MRGGILAWGGGGGGGIYLCGKEMGDWGSLPSEDLSSVSCILPAHFSGSSLGFVARHHKDFVCLSVSTGILLNDKFCKTIPSKKATVNVVVWYSAICIGMLRVICCDLLLLLYMVTDNPTLEFLLE